MPAKPNKPLTMHDSDRRTVKAGDVIQFSYGIPPVRVTAEVIEENGKLVALTPGHNPEQATLKQVRDWCEHFHKVDP
jgi:hypothetical protein